MGQWYNYEAMASQWSENDETLGNPRGIILSYAIWSAVGSKKL